VGLRFWRRVRLGPGITLNLSKGGASLSVGPPGAKLTVGTSGAQVTVGMPGTGLFWTQRLGAPQAPSGAAPSATVPGPAQLAWEEGILALHQDRLPAATERLGAAWAQRDRLPGGQAEVEVPITPELVLALAPDPRGAGLAYAEALQEQGRTDDAVAVLQQLKAEADAPVVRVALAELALEAEDPALALAATGRSTDPVVALYRARAKLALGRAADALEEVQRALRKAEPELHDDLEEVARAARAALGSG
jgi:tetratricopeptide (TPR) repeat protein